MSEREQKLEAAWHKALNAWMDCSRDSTIHEANKAAVSMLAEALATPPTSERDSVLSAAIVACKACRIGGRIDYNDGIDNCIDAIEQLKRKEQP